MNERESVEEAGSKQCFKTKFWLAGALTSAVVLNIGLMAFFFTATLHLCTPPWKTYPPLPSPAALSAARILDAARR